MSYQYLFEKTDKLALKPLKSDNIMTILNQKGIHPIQVTVDNILGNIIVYFNETLDRDKKKLLDETMNKLFKEWIK